MEWAPGHLPASCGPEDADADGSGAVCLAELLQELSSLRWASAAQRDLPCFAQTAPRTGKGQGRLLLFIQTLEPPDCFPSPLAAGKCVPTPPHPLGKMKEDPGGTQEWQMPLTPG